MKETNAVIFGVHAVKEALTMRPDVVQSVSTDDAEILTLAEQNGVVRKPFNPKKLPKDVPADAVHQGVIADIALSKLIREYGEFIGSLAVTDSIGLVILGEVQDPQNVGAVIRSAAAFGISGVLIPEYRQAQVGGTVIKVSAGMAFRVPLISIGNVNATIADLKERGFWIYGLDGTAKLALADESFEKPSVFVLGNEATGIRQKTLEHCDIPLRIPMAAGAESLNASAAAAVVFYAWSITHKTE